MTRRMTPEYRLRMRTFRSTDPANIDVMGLQIQVTHAQENVGQFYDQLPKNIRELMRESMVNFSAEEVLRIMRREGLHSDEMFDMLSDADDDQVKRLYELYKRQAREGLKAKSGSGNGGGKPAQRPHKE